MQGKRYSPKSLLAGIARSLDALGGRRGAMPAATTIGRKQRDALYQLVRDHLSGLNDVWIAMERDKDFATARRLGLEFGSDLRLLEDLGWGEEDDRETVVLTMLPSELERILNRLRDEAEEGFFGSPAERTSRAADEETDRRLLLAMNSCEELLGALDRHAERRSS